MPIFAECPEGHNLILREEVAGKLIKCPKCGSQTRVPDLEAQKLQEHPVDEPFNE